MQVRTYVVGFVLIAGCGAVAYFGDAAASANGAGYWWQDAAYWASSPTERQATDDFFAGTQPFHDAAGDDGVFEALDVLHGPFDSPAGRDAGSY